MHATEVPLSIWKGWCHQSLICIHYNLLSHFLWTSEHIGILQTASPSYSCQKRELTKLWSLAVKHLEREPGNAGSSKACFPLTPQFLKGQLWFFNISGGVSVGLYHPNQKKMMSFENHRNAKLMNPDPTSLSGRVYQCEAFSGHQDEKAAQETTLGLA